MTSALEYVKSLGSTFIDSEDKALQALISSHRYLRDENKKKIEKQRNRSWINTKIMKMIGEL